MIVLSLPGQYCYLYKNLKLQNQLHDSILLSKFGFPFALFKNPD